MGPSVVRAGPGDRTGSPPRPITEPPRVLLAPTYSPEVVTQHYQTIPVGRALRLTRVG